MHNCKATRQRLIDEAMSRPSSDQTGSLQAELELCPACREEFASLRSILRVADQSMQSALPAESFWPGYHARLRQSLEQGSSHTAPSDTRIGGLAGLRNLLQRLATTSVRVPVPAAAVLIVMFGLTIAYATHSRRQSITEQPTIPSPTITKTVEVPVIQERTVTRIVYRDRSDNREQARPQKIAQATATLPTRRNPPTESTPISLVGFKPTSDPKLTIIRGSYRDEK